MDGEFWASRMSPSKRHHTFQPPQTILGLFTLVPFGVCKICRCATDGVWALRKCNLVFLGLSEVLTSNTR